MKGNDYLCIVVELFRRVVSLNQTAPSWGRFFVVFFVNFLYKSVKNRTLCEKSLGKIWRYNIFDIILQV